MKNFMKRFLSLAFALVLTAGAVPALTTTADAAAATLTGYAHVQNVGNTKSVTGSSITLGTAKSGARLEAVSLKLNNVSGSIKYQAHIQNLGWKATVSNGRLAGTTSLALRLEAIKIWLEGDAANKYGVQYRAYIQNTKKWTDWMSNGNVAGTTGKAYTLEAIQVRLVENATSTASAKPIRCTVNENTTYYLSHHHGDCANYPLYLTFDGKSKITISKETNDNSQKLTFTKVPGTDGYYISFANSNGKVLESKSDGTVVMSKKSKAAGQIWYIEYGESNYYLHSAMDTYLYSDVVAVGRSTYSKYSGSVVKSCKAGSYKNNEWLFEI